MNVPMPDETGETRESPDPTDTLMQYRAVSLRALAALLLGIASPLAFVGPLLWLLPAIGVLAAVAALREIRGSGYALTGRTAAVAGLSLSLLCGTAAVTHQVAQRWWIRREAIDVSLAWFQFLLREQPHLAHQITLRLEERLPPGEDPWAFYRGYASAADALRGFVQQPLIRTLLALQRTATVRYWSTEFQQHYGRSPSYSRRDQLTQVYAVTFGDARRRTTFFARLMLQRSVPRGSSTARWQIIDFQGGVRPGARGEPPDAARASIP